MKTILMAVMAAAVLVVGQAASAISYSFANIAGGDTVGDAFNGWFTMDVTDAGGGNVLVKISNTGGGVIEQVFFDDANNLLNSFSIDLANTTPWVQPTPAPGAGVLFAADTSAGNFPQGENISFSTTDSLSAGSPAPKKGVGAGEVVGILAQGSYASLISGLDSGSFRAGLHVISLPLANAPSDSYVNNGRIPVPDAASTLILLGAVLLGAETTRRILARS